MLSFMMVLLTACFLLLSGSIAAAAPGVASELAVSDAVPLTLSTTASSVAAALKRRRGRPRKFGEPSRAVTLTLPETVLATLAHIDPDPSYAVARLARQKSRRKTGAAAELVVFGGRAVITIRPTPSLQQRSDIDLIPLPDGRSLMSFDQPHSIAELELLLTDALEDPALDANDRQTFESIVAILRDARRSSEIDIQQRSIIVIQANRSRRTNGNRAARG